MGGAIALNCVNAEIDDCTFTGNVAVDDAYAVVVSNTGNTIKNSRLKGEKQVYITSSGGLTMTSNTETSTDTDTYIIKNKGALSLSGNDFNTIIINDGVISSRTYANISGNATYNIPDFEYHATAIITDDTHQNQIISYSFNYLPNVTNTRVAAADNETHDATFDLIEFGFWLIDGVDDKLTDIFVYKTILNVTIREGSYTWLQNIIDNFNGDVLELTQNVAFNYTYDMHRNNQYYHQGIYLIDGMRYNKVFSFDGNGYTISGNNQARIFDVNPSTSNTLTISNTRFVNAYATGNGGALNIRTSSPTFWIYNSTN